MREEVQARIDPPREREPEPLGFHCYLCGYEFHEFDEYFSNGCECVCIDCVSDRKLEDITEIAGADRIDVLEQYGFKREDAGML